MLVPYDEGENSDVNYDIDSSRSSIFLDIVENRMETRFGPLASAGGLFLIKIFSISPLTIDKLIGGC